MDKLNFKIWLNEMVGTYAVYTGQKSPDFNWWGNPASMKRKRKKKKKKK
jgi:hypothetical protein